MKVYRVRNNYRLQLLVAKEMAHFKNRKMELTQRHGLVAYEPATYFWDHVGRMVYVAVDCRQNLNGFDLELEDGNSISRLHECLEPVGNGKRRAVYIDRDSWERALDLGKGDASEGIRKALRQHA